MTVNDALKEYKAQEIDEDREYMLSILEEEKKAEDRIKAIIAVWWATKKDRRKLYKSMNETLDELFDTLDEDFAVEFPKRYESGYLHSSYIAQMLQQEFSEVPMPGDYNIKWHLGGASYLDDMKYYRNRVFDSMKRELERMMILDAPANIAIDSATKPFKTLRNSTKALVDTECVYAERQGMREAYIKHDAERYRYIATLDTLTCSVCGSLDGNTFELAKAQVGVNYPPIHKWCRCTVIPVFDDFDSNSRVARDENGENVEVTMSYDQWADEYAGNFREESLRSKSSGDYGVDWKIVKSKEYTNRFNALSDNEKANSLAAQRSRNALVNRNGKNTEELYAISLTTGKDISKITGQHITSGVKRTDEFMRDVARAEANGEDVLFIHNHPGGLPPSIADLNELLAHERAVGITVGHNGSIYYYTKPNREIEEFDLNVAIRKTKQYNGITAEEKTLEELSKQFKFEFRKL